MSAEGTAPAPAEAEPALFDKGKTIEDATDPAAPAAPEAKNPAIGPCGPDCPCLNMGKNGGYRLVLGVNWGTGEDGKPLEVSVMEAHEAFGILALKERQMVGERYGVFRGTEGLEDSEMGDKFGRGWKTRLADMEAKLARSIPLVRRTLAEERKSCGDESLAAQVLTGMGFKEIGKTDLPPGLASIVSSLSGRAFSMKIPNPNPADKPEVVPVAAGTEAAAPCAEAKS